jgi:hypothetical protein
VIGCETMHSIWPQSLQCESYDLCIDRSTDLMCHQPSLSSLLREKRGALSLILPVIGQQTSHVIFLLSNF